MRLGLETEASDGETATTPERIGPYRLLQILGEGGMGIVYLAEQTEPVRRRVALKLIKLGMDTRQVLARFEAERQALAIMNHPNVAKVFDAGATDQGRPYFVMEYVPGMPITEYCDLKCLSLRERLTLFTKTCEAIQHAHQKGIIHRDIKPSNVLVASEDGRPRLKVIDFGVAKATGQSLTEQTLFTEQGIPIGTPEYMSPEQAGTTALSVDTRTDIYSLGVLLYELLVGALPFDPATLRRAAAVEMLRIIREEDPPRPTTRFRSLGDTASEIARRRHTDVSSLARQLRGELEWITMRALEKNPAGRYASASELGDDVRRHLQDEPVVAGPPSRWYRTVKFVRKNRVAVAVTTVFVIVLSAASVVSTGLYLRSRAARRSAQQEALRNRLDVEAIQAALLGDADGYHERSLRALEIHRSLKDPRDPDYAIYLANRLAILHETYGFEDAADRTALAGFLEAMQQEALAALRNVLPGGDPRLIEALEIVSEFGGLTAEEHEWAHREALALARRYAPDDPILTDKLDHLARVAESRSVSLRSGGNHADADALESEAVALRREAMHRSASTEELADLLDRRGTRLSATGRFADAEPVLRESLSLLERIPSPPVRRIAELRTRLGRCLLEQGRFPEAEPLLLRSSETLEGDLDGKSASSQMATRALIELYERWNRPEEARRYRQRVTRPSVSSVRELGALQFAPDVSGRLGGHSTSLANRSLWVFKFTRLEGCCETGTADCSATWSWTDDLRATDGIGGFRDGIAENRCFAEALPFTGEEQAYNRAHNTSDCVEDCGSITVLRTGAIALDAARNRALQFYHRGTDRNLPWQFVRQGTSIAIWTEPERKPVRPPTGAGHTDLFSSDEPWWGSAALVADEDLYAFACECEDTDCPCLLARAPLARALDREAWRFYAGGDRWSTDWRAATPVMNAASELTVHWNEYLDAYLAIHQVPRQRTIALRVAERPQGPWSEPRLYLVETPRAPGQGWHNESALGHPEFSRDGGRIEYITYHRATRGFWVGETRLIEIVFE